MVIDFIQGGNPYEKLNIGDFRKPKIGDMVYIKSDANELVYKLLENIPFGNYDSVKEWIKILTHIDKTVPYLVKEVQGDIISIDFKGRVLEIDTFLINFKNI